MATYEERYADHPDRTRHNDDENKRVSEDANTQPNRKSCCPLYSGVMCYLHQLYKDHVVKDRRVYENDDNQLLLHRQYRRQRCTPMWWKLLMWIGIILLLLGIIAILIGYLMPSHHVLSESSENLNGDIHVDKKAQEYNTILGMCKFIGFILFCIGGLTLAMSLIVSSFFTEYCEDLPEDPVIDAPLKYSRDTEEGPLSSPEVVIPTFSIVKGIQPTETVHRLTLV